MKTTTAAIILIDSKDQALVVRALDNGAPEDLGKTLVNEFLTFRHIHADLIEDGDFVGIAKNGAVTRNRDANELSHVTYPSLAHALRDNVDYRYVYDAGWYIAEDGKLTDLEEFLHAR